MRNNKLKDKKNYKFRASLTRIARCGMCKQTIRRHCGRDGDLVIHCKEGHQLVYPLINGEHNCLDYEYLPREMPIIPIKKLVMDGIGVMDRLPECASCSHNLEGYCDGVDWYPFEIKPICEFYRNINLICKYAVPYFQYGTTIRNNYCRKNPKKRYGDQKRGWKWNCPLAHKKYVEHYNCYRPRRNRE